MLTSTLSVVALALCRVVVGDTADIVSELGPSLSSSARVLVPDHEDFVSATHRWDAYNAPQFGSVVEVASEEDVVKVVKYANEHSLPFLAVNGGHGSTISFNKFKNGIGILLKKLNGVDVKGDRATIQGGATAHDVVNKLWEQGKQTVQPVAECTGFMGATLGGGRAILQSRHGLGVDNMFSARVVLADGSVITASADSHPDLFWGLRGAGHNFGIVTEAEFKVFDVDQTQLWYHETFVFLPHQVVPFAEQAFKLGDALPERLSFGTTILKLPPVDPVNPVVIFTMLYDGPASEADVYAEPFRKLRGIPFMNGTVPFVNLASVLQQGINDDACLGDGRRRVRFATELAGKKNPTGFLDVYNEFNKSTTEQPAFARSVILMEGIPAHAAAAVSLDTTAVPDRENTMMAFPVVTYTDSALDEEAVNFGKRIRNGFRSIVNVKKPSLYVNQAWGDEGLEAFYGYESWRIEKLRTLKKEYDPENRFRFYAPINPASDAPEGVKDEL